MVNQEPREHGSGPRWNLALLGALKGEDNRKFLWAFIVLLMTLLQGCLALPPPEDGYAVAEPAPYYDAYPYAAYGGVFIGPEVHARFHEEHHRAGNLEGFRRERHEGFRGGHQQGGHGGPHQGHPWH